MRLFDAFPDPSEGDGLSLAEEAALHAPPLWEPTRIHPEGLSYLPADFPVEDPFGQRESTRRIISIMQERAHCRTKNCDLDDRHVLAREAAEVAVEAIGVLQGVAASLFAHGEALVAELIVDGLCALAEDVLKPFFDSADINSEMGDDDE